MPCDQAGQHEGYAGRQHRPSDQCVQLGGLAPLELADDGDDAPATSEPIGAAGLRSPRGDRHEATSWCAFDLRSSSSLPAACDAPVSRKEGPSARRPGRGRGTVAAAEANAVGAGPVAPRWVVRL